MRISIYKEPIKQPIESLGKIETNTGNEKIKILFPDLEFNRRQIKLVDFSSLSEVKTTDASYVANSLIDSFTSLARYFLFLGAVYLGVSLGSQTF